MTKVDYDTIYRCILKFGYSVDIIDNKIIVGNKNVTPWVYDGTGWYWGMIEVPVSFVIGGTYRREFGKNI